MSRSSVVGKSFTMLKHIFRDIDDHKNEYMAMEFVGKDYTRKRKLSMYQVLESLFSFRGSSLHNEFNRVNVHDRLNCSLCAFVRARDKISIRGIKLILEKLNRKMSYDSRFKGYRLLAIDGSKIGIYPDKKNDDIYKHKSKCNGKPFSLIHVSAVFDVLNKVFVSCKVNKEEEDDEKDDAVTFVKENIDSKNIYVCDRGYESYNLFYNIMKTCQYFVIRAKDIGSSISISQRVVRMYEDIGDEFDKTVTITLTRKNMKDPRFATLTDKTKRRDYFKDNGDKDYDITLRIVRFKLESPKKEDNYECLITNLSEDLMSVEDLKEIYRLRWGIEVGFMHLKYAIGVNRFHTKKLKELEKEVWIRLINYNLDSLIITQIAKERIKKEDRKRKYSYAISFSRAAYIIHDAYRTTVSKDLDIKIAAMVIPVKPDRHFDRNVKPQSYQTFCYRYS